MIPLWSAVYWTIALLAGFLPVELYAAKSKPLGDTFSEFTWDVFGVKKPRPFGRLRRIILGSFLGALYFHLVFGTTVLPVAVLAFPLAGVILYWFVKESPVAGSTGGNVSKLLAVWNFLSGKKTKIGAALILIGKGAAAVGQEWGPAVEKAGEILVGVGLTHTAVKGE